jgi:hypothetical protein
MHDNEHRLDDSQRRRVAQMYFPLVLTVIDQHEALESAPEDFQSKVMACFMWVLQGMSESLMREYIDRESEKRLFTFLSLVEKALLLFRWQDKQYAMVKRAVPLEPNKHFTVGYIDPGAQYQTLRQSSYYSIPCPCWRILLPLCLLPNRPSRYVSQATEARLIKSHLCLS